MRAVTRSFQLALLGLALLLAGCAPVASDEQAATPGPSGADLTAPPTSGEPTGSPTSPDAGGAADPADVAGPGAGPATPPTMVPEEHPVDLDDPRDGALLPPEPPAEPTPRLRRRMDIDQLSASIRRVTGGVAWTEGDRDGAPDLFEALAATLGRPDYVEITEEVLEPGIIFQKFLDDAARAVCERLTAREVSGEATERILLRHVGATDTHSTAPDAVERNLRALLLRFHGHDLPADHDLLQPWRWLFASALHVSGDAPTAWQTVCVGLLRHPDFYLY